MAVAHSGTSPHVPTYERKRAASACDYACFGAQRTPPSGPARSSATIHTIGAATTLPGEQQTLQAHKVGQSVGPICSSAQREKRSRPPAAAFGQRRQLAQSNCCGQRKRQTAQLGSHARESEGGVSLASVADRAWLCAADLLEHTLSRLTAGVDRESAMFWPRARARHRCHAIVIAGATFWIDVTCCVAREVQARLLCHHEHRFLSLGCGRLSPTGTNVRCKEERMPAILMRAGPSMSVRSC